LGQYRFFRNTGRSQYVRGTKIGAGWEGNKQRAKQTTLLRRFGGKKTGNLGRKWGGGKEVKKKKE